MQTKEKSLPDSMRAAVVSRYGGPEVIEIINMPLPVLKPDMLMVKICASTVNSADVRTRALQAKEPLRSFMRLALGIKRPRQSILGTVYAGVVAAAGKDVKAYKAGDRVFGASPGMSFGCHAEYVAVKEESAIALVPEGAKMADIASLVFGGATALFFLEKAGTAQGKTALIYGASGAVGSMAVQIAGNLGLHVTGVSSAKNRKLLMSLGAEKFIDYTAPGFNIPAAKYDIVFDAVGKLPKKMALQALNRGGKYVTVGGASVSKENKKHMESLAQWCAVGKLKPVIHERFNFEDIRKAHALVDTGHKKGSVVLLIDKEENYD